VLSSATFGVVEEMDASEAETKPSYEFAVSQARSEPSAVAIQSASNAARVAVFAYAG
jgi:hypothetical protein